MENFGKLWKTMEKDENFQKMKSLKNITNLNKNENLENNLEKIKKKDIWKTM